MDSGAWQVAVQGVAKSRAWLSDWTTRSLLAFCCRGLKVLILSWEKKAIFKKKLEIDRYVSLCCPNRNVRRERWSLKNVLSLSFLSSLGDPMPLQWTSQLIPCPEIWREVCPWAGNRALCAFTSDCEPQDGSWKCCFPTSVGRSVGPGSECFHFLALWFVRGACVSKQIFYFMSYFIFGVLLLYRVMLVSAVQWSESAICIHISPPSWAPHSPPPSHPSRSSQSTDLSSLCYTAASH